ncbi:DUF2325 domain-containing protein [Desulfuribacillus alkaliarsenatis]|uniref:Dihydroorotate dehydrogenase n=1 Tax=Desulfuribacillus alkaliarsenatis TaxID=766136 RepID=A0A1E5FZG2_9FIRM|nr:DUF2325 domain-containing protein [Desulfuribacillus alkaliarsenatis]OEF95892.1 dihydroorotate dehydrogenase [Desulfuribacillus alkaliarsenatis]
MSILVIGGDRLGNIDKNLKGIGFNRIEHVDGRKKRHYNVNISQGTDVVLVLTDYVNHNLCKSIKEKAKGLGVKTVFSRRAWSDIATAIN